jgi:hypothetical protein
MNTNQRSFHNDSNSSILGKSSSNNDWNNNNNNNDQRLSVLVMGASGRLGRHCLHALHSHTHHPAVHAFVRNPDRLSPKDQLVCDSVLQGDALCEADVYQALYQSRAQVVLMCVGRDVTVTQHGIRTRAAAVLAQVLHHTPSFRHVHVWAVSLVGGKTPDAVPWHMGRRVTQYLRYHYGHFLSDHAGQEAMLLHHSTLMGRTTIVRTTLLQEGPSNKLNRIVQFDTRPASMVTNRADLAEWIARRMCETKSGEGDDVYHVSGSR